MYDNFKARQEAYIKIELYHETITIKTEIYIND